jgi:lysophospholipase L1-like esterase
MTEPLRFVALGDSYTIGTAVEEAERWPDQLVARLAADTADGRPLELVANLAVNGYTSDDVVTYELPRMADVEFGFASILVGVNDVVQRVPHETFAANAATILDTFLGDLAPSRIVAVATPDYTVTPAGADYGDPAAKRAGIERNNEILAELCAARGIAFVDTYAISRRAGIDRLLVAVDGLHPSGRQYSLWVDAIEPVVRELLER